MKKIYFCGDDYLGLGAYGKSIRNLIEKSENIVRSNDNESFVIAIDAPWGTGKTYFVRMLESYLNGDWKNPTLSDSEINRAEERTGLKGETDYYSKLRVIYYDAWSNDFWNNAFEPFYDTVINDIAGYKDISSEEVISAFKSVGKIISIGFNAYLKNKFGEPYEVIKDTVDSITVEGKALIQGDYATISIFPDYSAFRNAIYGLKKLLNITIEQFQKEHGIDAKIVIIIDELDRCRPVFSVQTLEIVKHFFNIKGLVFVFSLDISQLRYCVKNVYGEQFDAEGYLERFFNYLSNLPQGNYRPLIKLFNEEAKRVDSNWHEIKGTLLNAFCEIARVFCLSLRDLRIVLSSLQLLEQNTLQKHSDYPYARILYFYFLAFKYKKPDEYRRAFLKGELNIFKSLLGNRETSIPYYSYERTNPDYECMQNSDKRNSILMNVLTSKSKLKQLEMKLISVDSKTEYAKDWFSCFDGIHLVGEIRRDYRLSDHQTLGFLLYEPDIVSDMAKSGILFELIPADYLNKQLEMIDFSNFQV